MYITCTMSWNIGPHDLYKRFFGRGMNPFGGSRGFGFGSIFKEFDEMQQEMDRMFEDIGDIEKNAPKELVREYTTKDGAKVREVGPIVYGYSMTIGSDGKPKVKEFGNVKPSGKGFTTLGKPLISAEREALADVSVSDKEVKVIVEMPGVKKENIKINAYDGVVEIRTDDAQRKYHQVIDLPEEADIETARSTYNNGILEVTFNKKKQSKPKGKDIKVE